MTEGLFSTTDTHGGRDMIDSDVLPIDPKSCVYNRLSALLGMTDLAGERSLPPLGVVARIQDRLFKKAVVHTASAFRQLNGLSGFTGLAC